MKPAKSCKIAIGKKFRADVDPRVATEAAKKTLPRPGTAAVEGKVGRGAPSAPLETYMPDALRGFNVLLTSKSKQVALGSDVHKIFGEGWCRGNFLADNVSSQDFQLLRARIDDNDRAPV